MDSILNQRTGWQQLGILHGFKYFFGERIMATFILVCQFKILYH